jgi:hypothetical protein
MFVAPRIVDLHDLNLFDDAIKKISIIAAYIILMDKMDISTD